MAIKKLVCMELDALYFLNNKREQQVGVTTIRTRKVFVRGVRK